MDDIFPNFTLDKLDDIGSKLGNQLLLEYIFGGCFNKSVLQVTLACPDHQIVKEIPLIVILIFEEVMPKLIGWPFSGVVEV